MKMVQGADNWRENFMQCCDALGSFRVGIVSEIPPQHISASTWIEVDGRFMIPVSLTFSITLVQPDHAARLFQAVAVETEAFFDEGLK